MKTESYENMKKFFERIKNIGFFERIFSWGEIRSLSYDAFEEFKIVDKRIGQLSSDLDEEKGNSKGLAKDVEHQKEMVKKLDKEFEALKLKHDELTKSNLETAKSLAEYKKMEKKNQEEYAKSVSELNLLKKQLDDDRIKIEAERAEKMREQFEKQKQTWREHEKSVEEYIQTICSKHTVDYVQKEKVPFKGKPDNTIKICDEYVIFDAKSPQGDDLDNFPGYVRSQAEAVKKYAKEPNVRKDIFLVIPSNTVEQIDDYYFNMADYNVYVVTKDSLEPIILALQKIEDYEFAEKMSPEERESICRVLAKFAHTTKRRIQIDSFFCKEFIGVLSSCNRLPENIQEQAAEFEKADKLNPPLEKRAKVIKPAELHGEIKRLQLEGASKEINMNADFGALEKIPLHKKSEMNGKSPEEM